LNSSITTLGKAPTQETGLPFLTRLARFILQLKGWRLEINLPAAPKYILIGAPHTSNRDGVYAVLLRFAANIPMRFIAKESLFKPPFGFLIRWFGGIPVDRSASTNFVDQIVARFNESDALVIAISPEGTRSKTLYWRTGFYFMALNAGVPIAFGSIDYATRTLGIQPGIEPSGDLPADMEHIRNFYTQTVQLYRKGKREITLKDS
jgi:1-acyl-sn-glycerol-3-phosphate acyltransferase